MAYRAGLGVRIAEALLDKVALREPRLFGASLRLYALPLLGFALIEATRAVLNTLQPDSLLHDAAGPLLFALGIAWIGRVAAPGLMPLDNNGDNYTRILEARAYRILRGLARDGLGAPKPPGSIYVYSLLVVNILLLAWLLLKPRDTLFTVSLFLAERGNIRGYIGLSLDIASTACFALFWNIVAIVLSRILWVHHWALTALKKLVEQELSGGEALRLNELLRDMLRHERPALHFLRFYRGLAELARPANALMKRLAVLAIIATLAAPLMDLNIYGGITYGALSAALISCGLIFPTMWSLYEVARWDGELQRLLVVELRNLRIAAYQRGEAALAEAARELEELANRLRHPLVAPREAWELVGAMATLAATVLGAVAAR